MNTLTVNLHLLMVSFYRPTKNTKSFVRKSIPSDQYMFQSQVNFHGYKADDLWRLNVVMEHNIRTEDVLAKINEVGDWHWF
jgi:kynureninase